MASPGQSERERCLCISDRGRILGLPVSEVVYIAVVVRQCGFLDC